MEYPCELCGKKFISEYHLKRHQNSIKKCTDPVHIYICDICGYNTKDKSKFTRHKNRKNPCKKKALDINDQLVNMTNTIREMNNQIKTLTKQNKKPRIMNNYNFIISNYNDAKNIEECLHIDNISDEIFQKCKNTPLKNGSFLILDQLCNIDESARPIHCVDVNRNNYVIKSENKWCKDPKAETIKSHMIPIVTNVYNNVHKEKMQEKNLSIDEKLSRMADMDELRSINVNKACENSIKKSASNYTMQINNIDTGLLDDDE